MTTVRLVGPRQREYAKQMIDDAPDGYVVKFGKETRRDKQNRLLWALLKDVQRDVPSMATFSAEDMKNRFMNALGVEMRFLPTLEGEGVFPIGMRSSTLTVQQFSALCELIIKYGSENGVRWSSPPV